MAFEKIRFVTDSTCDIPPAVIEKWQIAVVPTYINFDNQSFADDGEYFDRQDYYSKLSTLNPFPTTAAPSPGECKQIITQAFEGADHLFVVVAPASLSAIYQSVRLGIADLPQDRVTLIDSGTTTMAMGYQVEIGAEVAAATGDIAQVKQAIDRVRQYGHMVAMVNHLDNLRRSGRLNMAAAGIGTLLQIKPIITVRDGNVDVLSRVRTSKRAREEMVNRIREQAPLDRLTLLHVNNPEGAAWMREQLADMLPDEVYEINVTPTLGTHVGTDSLGFVTVNQNWRL